MSAEIRDDQRSSAAHSFGMCKVIDDGCLEILPAVSVAAALFYAGFALCLSRLSALFIFLTLVQWEICTQSVLISPVITAISRGTV